VSTTVARPAVPTSGQVAGVIANQSKASVVQGVHTPPAWLQYGGSYATAFAAILAATLATRVALRGIRENRNNILDQLNLQRELSARTSWANVVSANRQRWIDSLREDLANFISADFYLAEAASIEDDDFSEQAVKLREIAAEAKKTRRLMFRRIQLRINREKPDQEALWQAIRAVMPATGAKHRRAVRELTDISRRVLRNEWLRVKEEASGLGAQIAPVSSQMDDTPSDVDIPASVRNSVIR
jgi:hypothetical protein